MNKRKILLTVGFLAIASLVLTTAMMVRHNNVSGFLETPTSYEENHTDIELDFWLNVSGTLSPFASMEMEESSFQLLHARYSFSSREALETIYGYDIFSPEFMVENQLMFLRSSDYLARIVESSRSGIGIEACPGFYFELFSNSDDQVDNYWAVGGATTSAITYPFETEESFIDDGAQTTYLMNWTKAIDDTSEPTLTLDSQNLLVKDDDSQFLGTKYFAGDAMSFQEYSQAIADQGGVTLYNIANTSIIGWLMEDDQINTVNIDFEEPEAVSSSPAGAMSTRGGILKRFSFSLLKRRRENVYSTSSSLFRNFFSRLPISRVISGIRSVPSKANFYAYKQVGSAWQQKQLGLRSIAGGIKQSMGKLMGTIFSGTGLTIMAIGYVGIGAIKSFRGGSFAWKPWKRDQWKLK